MTSIVFDLDRVTAYCKTNKPREVYQAWTITARVDCDGFSRLELRGPLLQDVWISDAFLLDDDGRNVNLVPADAIFSTRNRNM
jgi:hypothetical protein